MRCEFLRGHGIFTTLFVGFAGLYVYFHFFLRFLLLVCNRLVYFFCRHCWLALRPNSTVTFDFNLLCSSTRHLLPRPSRRRRLRTALRVELMFLTALLAICLHCGVVVAAAGYCVMFLCALGDHSTWHDLLCLLVASAAHIELFPTLYKCLLRSSFGFCWFLVMWHLLTGSLVLFLAVSKQRRLAQMIDFTVEASSANPQPSYPSTWPTVRLTRQSFRVHPQN